MVKNKRVNWKLIMIIILAVIIAIFLIQKYITKPILPSPQDVTRSFDKTTALVDEQIAVTLNIEAGSTDYVYSIEDVLPVEAVVSDQGGGTLSGNILRWLESTSDPVANPLPGSKIYIISFPNMGTYGFSGTSAFNDEPSLTIILGDDQVDIVGCISDSDCDDNKYCTTDFCSAGSCSNIADVCKADTDTDGWVDTSEIASYINKWLTGDAGVTQTEVTNSAYSWETDNTYAHPTE